MSDIVGIADRSGNLVVSYAYDAWGKVLSVTGSNTEIGNLNPFRYRSYYYDSDIEMYYLQSRYYYPEVCRFINSDDVNYIGVNGIKLSYNSFAYCENDAVNSWDSSGHASLSFNKINYAINSIIYMLNQKKLKNKYISGQEIFAGKNMLFGVGRLSYNGCGPIAIYNALLMFGVYIPLHKILYQAEKEGALRLKGVLGMETGYPLTFFNNKTYANKTFGAKWYDSAGGMDARRKKGDVFIILMECKNLGHHFVAIKSVSKTKVVAYNYHTASNGTVDSSSISKLLKDRNNNFLVGFKIYTK